MLANFYSFTSLLQFYYYYYYSKKGVRNKSKVIPKSKVIRWIPNPGVPCSKPLGGSKVDSAFHPPEVDRMSTRNFWELSGKK